MPAEHTSAGGFKPEAQIHHESLPRVEIHLNTRPVYLIGHRHTGLEIKRAAIEQHIKIELDFLLYMLRYGEPNKLVADDEEIHVTDESRFQAIGDDDNS